MTYLEIQKEIIQKEIDCLSIIIEMFPKEIDLILEAKKLKIQKLKSLVKLSA